MSRTELSSVPFALGSLLLVASCAQQDGVERSGGPATPTVSANVSSGPGPDFYVSPTGSPSGDGSFTNPWDLVTALNGPTTVTPGSTIWLRGGMYTNGTYHGGYWSNLTGTAAAPIVVRQYPGERAIVQNNLGIWGSDTWYWGFEVVNPDPTGSHILGINTRGPRTKLINLVVHDASASGIFVGLEATDAEVYGSISYNNGSVNNQDHGIYCQSQTSNLLQDNIVFDNWAYGLHCYAEAGEYLQNIHLQGNVAFNNNAISGVPWGGDVLVGGAVPALGIIVDQNYTYRTLPSDYALDLGYSTASQDLVATNNYLVGGSWHVAPWVTATVTGNTLYNFTSGGMVSNTGDLRGHSWSGNTFFGDSTASAWLYNTVTTFSGWRTLTGFSNPGTYAGSTPTGVKIVLRPNHYEPSRANIIVYDWAQQSTVSVDVSGILNVGDHYVVQNAQDFYGIPATSGTYDGSPLQLPIAGIMPPTPLGNRAVQAAPVTGPTFNVFVLMRTP